MKWRPIEDAPKDGTTVLLFRKSDKHQDRLGIGRWCGENWYETGISQARRVSPEKATHWMPLPEMPEIDKGVPKPEEGKSPS